MLSLWSHTLRGCVDWNFTNNKKLVEQLVTPFVGVWIETYGMICLMKICKVTPFVGVWIETEQQEHYARQWYVTPFVGVWIETIKVYLNSILKIVTPFVGVWIETKTAHGRSSPTLGHTLRGCVDWNFNLDVSDVRPVSHPSWVCGLKLRIPLDNMKPVFGHTLRGCVDWNIRSSSRVALTVVTPFVGVWIETVRPAYFCIVAVSHPSWVCGLKQVRRHCKYRTQLSHPSWVCGLKRKAHEELQRQGRSHPSWVCGLKHTLLNPSLTL